MKSPLFQYDKAVYDLIHGLYDEVFNGPPDEIMSINAKKHNGKVVLPFIGVYRLPDFNINTDYYNDSRVRRGYHGKTTDSDIEFPNQMVAMYGLDVTLQYQIDVYAHKRDVCDGLTAELMMFLKQNPYVNVQIMDMGEVVKEFNFDLDENVTDNTEIGDFSESGRLYRLTLNASITDALIYKIDRYNRVDKIYVNFHDMSESSKIDIDLDSFDKSHIYKDEDDSSDTDYCDGNIVDYNMD